VRRLSTLASGGRIAVADVDEELTRLRETQTTSQHGAGLAEQVLGLRAATLDRFDRVQLDDVLSVCRVSRSLSEAGRTLFAQSLITKAAKNGSCSTSGEAFRESRPQRVIEAVRASTGRLASEAMTSSTMRANSTSEPLSFTRRLHSFRGHSRRFR